MKRYLVILLLCGLTRIEAMSSAQQAMRNAWNRGYQAAKQKYQSMAAQYNAIPVEARSDIKLCAGTVAAVAGAGALSGYVANQRRQAEYELQQQKEAIRRLQRRTTYPYASWGSWDKW